MTYQTKLNIGDVITIGSNTQQKVVVESISGEDGYGEFAVVNFKRFVFQESTVEEPEIFYLDEDLNNDIENVVRSCHIKVVGKMKIEKSLVVTYYMSKFEEY